MQCLDRLVRAEAKAQGRVLRALDPFAGTGRGMGIGGAKVSVVGVEIEPEWAAQHPGIVCADSLKWMTARARAGGSGRFDVVWSSPTYGNRMADHHDARDGSVRHSYTHDLGRPLTDGNSGNMAWGPAYHQFHADAYRRILAVLRPGGLLLWNVSDFVRKGVVVHAVEWHHGALCGAGFIQSARPRWITTRRLRHGENRAARVDAECVLVMRKPEL